ncbi:MAG: DNA polymerase III subunit alpha [Solirubrobacteraceae bacterium]
MSSYVELHCHSAYSFLDGASLPEELVLAAAERGYRALALTDHDGVHGSMEFARAAAGLELKAIHGTEVTVNIDPRPGPWRRDARGRGRAIDADAARRSSGVGSGSGNGSAASDGPVPPRGTTLAPPADADLRHLTLLVRDATGWASLCRLLTRAHAHTRDHPQRERTRPWVTIADVCDHHGGLVCLSGCADRGIQEEGTLRMLRDAFGTEDLYVELQRPVLREDREQGVRRARLARRLGLRTIATGNVHAHSRARALLQDALVAVRHHATLDATEPLRRGNHTHVMTTPAAMAARFADHPDAVAETARLAERLEFDLTKDLGYRYPGQDDEEAPRRLAEACWHHFEERYTPEAIRRGPATRALDHDGVHGIRTQARGRLGEELDLIARLGLSGFFLLHHEILELARDVATDVRGPSAARALLPPGRGRGSSVSSIVCYLTGLSHVDPVANDLGIGRFLHEETGADLPDIDLDFPRDIREQLILRVHERYGNERAALVAAFPTYRARGTIRDLGAALGLPATELERVARASEGWSGRDVGRDIAAVLLGRDGAGGPGDPGPGPPAGGEPGRGGTGHGGPPGAPGSPLDEDPGRGLPGRWAWLARLAAMAHGLPRHLSQHPGGMIISTLPLVDCCPVVPSATPGRQMIMWDKDSCTDAGFAKVDLLGLGMLSCVDRCVDLIAQRRTAPLDISRIPLDDRDTFGAIQRAETTGVFQIESRAQMGSLLRTRPENLHDLTIQVAIVRPGPIQGGAVNPYIERRRRLREDQDFRIPYPHPSLEDALRPTLGAILFQDQVVEVAQAFAGFSPGRAGGLRRAMSRKRSEKAMAAEHEGFVQGAMATHGVDRALAEEVWGMVSGFSGFGFPKGHAVAFGLLAYQSTWLRVHHPAEFLCALLDEQPMGFYAPDALIHEAQRRKITVLPPDVRHSRDHCTVTDDGAVRIGLGYVKGVRAEEVSALVAERDRHGPWRSLADLAARAGMSTASLERLAWAGACDDLAGGDPGRRRRVALWRLGALAPGRSVAEGTQLALGLDLGTHVAERDLRGLGPWEQMIADYATTGVSSTVHPMRLLRPRLADRRIHHSEQLGRLRHGTPVRVAGLVLARQRPGSAGGMTFVLLEDEHGTINLVLPPPVYERHRLEIRTEPLVIADGRLERFAAGGGQINIVVGSYRALDHVLDDHTGRDDAKVVRLRDLPAERVERWQAQAAEEHQLPAVAAGGGGAVIVASPGRGPTADGSAGAGFRSVAPESMNFGRGRSR